MSGSGMHAWPPKRVRFVSGVGGLLCLGMAILFIRGIVNWGVNLMSVALTACPAMGALLLIWYAIRGHSEWEVKIIESGWKWGFIVGGIGLGIGVAIWPMIVRYVMGEEANQAPLLGFLITGPTGFYIGVLIGILLGVYRQRSFG